MYYSPMKDSVGVLLAAVLKKNFEIVHLRLKFSVVLSTVKKEGLLNANSLITS